MTNVTGFILKNALNSETIYYNNIISMVQRQIVNFAVIYIPSELSL